tara:strand:- start:1301 stop:1888 length:588 start_codon:yes stop_codon:yes gene_type:complete
MRRRIGKNDDIVTVGSTPSLKRAMANLEDLEGYKGINILQNAATVGFDVMRDKSIENFSQLTFGRKSRAYVKGRRGIETFGKTKAGKGKKIRSVRKSLTQRGSYSVEATKTRTGLVARQYINSKHYYNYVSHMIEGGYTPGGGTKYEGSYVKAQPFRRPVGVRYNDRVANVMKEAIALQLEQGKRIGLGKLRTML